MVHAMTMNFFFSFKLINENTNIKIETFLYYILIYIFVSNIEILQPKTKTKFHE